ncbi:unnamed protein product [Cyclocybe aegerita]|uniref:Uncharacterized protein n=1 Tax=Cyclocybe aegerita TaxID=1973307 RepID=A0A8S0XR96_CYCAE|nr:unnamed protein product [Cyclocybe aegerita]
MSPLVAPILGNDFLGAVREQLSTFAMTLSADFQSPFPPNKIAGAQHLPPATYLPPLTFYYSATPVGESRILPLSRSSFSGWSRVYVSLTNLHRHSQSYLAFEKRSTGQGAVLPIPHAPSVLSVPLLPPRRHNRVFCAHQQKGLFIVILPRGHPIVAQLSYTVRVAVQLPFQRSRAVRVSKASRRVMRPALELAVIHHQHPSVRLLTSFVRQYDHLQPLNRRLHTSLSNALLGRIDAEGKGGIA